MNKSLSRDSVFLENIIRSIPQYTFWKDVNSVYLGCNDNYARLLGLNSTEDIVGKTDLDIGWLPDGDTAELFRQGDQETMRGKFVSNQEEWLSLADGTKILVLVNKQPILDNEGNVLGVLGIATDITEKKRTERELIETQTKLDGMTIVGASIAHELHTPLASLDLGIQNIKKFFPALVDAYQQATQAGLPVTPIKPRAIELLAKLPELMNIETKAAFTFIDMLLTNIRPVLDVDETNHFSIAECVNEAVSRYPFKPEQQELLNIDLNNDFDVKGKKLLVIHVLFNLFKNALHYIAKARKGQIDIWFEKGMPYNTLHFKDTGSGISAEHLPLIFERFFTKTHQGAGVGLSYCKMVMDSMNGMIVCESIEGSYTLFKLQFPAS